MRFVFWTIKSDDILKNALKSPLSIAHQQMH
jgi:hypothetical protein